MPKTQFCGLVASHDAHRWVKAWRWWRIRIPGRARWCEGAFLAQCGRDLTHPPHWHGELHDELCRGDGLAGVCRHGEQMLNDCTKCHEHYDLCAGGLCFESDTTDICGCWCHSPLPVRR